MTVLLAWGNVFLVASLQEGGKTTATLYFMRLKNQPDEYFGVLSVMTATVNYFNGS